MQLDEVFIKFYKYLDNVLTKHYLLETQGIYVLSVKFDPTALISSFWKLKVTTKIINTGDFLRNDTATIVGFRRIQVNGICEIIPKVRLTYLNILIYIHRSNCGRRFQQPQSQIGCP